MEVTRRNAMFMGAGALAVFGLPLRATTQDIEAITAFTGGAEMADSGVLAVAAVSWRGSRRGDRRTRSSSSG